MSLQEINWNLLRGAEARQLGTAIQTRKAEDRIRELERELNAAYAEMRKVRKHVGAVYDYAIWDKANDAGGDHHGSH